MDGVELFWGDAFFEEEVDPGIGKRTPECKDEFHFGFVQVVAELLKRAFEVIPGNGPKIEIGHGLLGKALQHIDAHIGGDIFDTEWCVLGHAGHRSRWRLTGST